LLFTYQIMKKQLLIIFALTIFSLSLQAQTCLSGGCAATATNSTGQYPSSTFTTSSSSWSTVSSYMNAGNFTLFDVTNGDTYEWSYCSDFGGSQSWDAELTLFNNSTGVKLCYQDNCGKTNCTTAPYIRWTATFTGTVKLLTTVSGCGINTGSPYSTLVWRDTSGTPLVHITGVDVYSGNSTINWNQVKAAGYTFAYAKATEGVGYTDSEYLNYAVNGVTAGMKMGAYHFARGDLNPTTAGAINEANYFLSVAQPYIISCELPPALDLEGSYWQSNFTSAQLTAWIQNWMTTVESATGIKPVLYIGSSNCSYVNSSLNTYPLWRDDLSGSPNTAPANIGVWTTWAFNQYSWTATVPGIAGSQTDVNVFNGNTAAFNTFMGCSTTTVKQNNLSAVIVYPNPASNKLFIENFNSYATGYTVEVRNLLGDLLLKENFFEQKATLSIIDFPKGVYSISVGNEQGSRVFKIIKD
jgi:lysozyme